jgi:hypothetical protein
MVSEALIDFDIADINNNLFDFHTSTTARRLDRA